VVLFAMLVGGIQFNPSVMGIAGAAVLGGIVAVGSNRSTANEASGELTALEAKRTTLIGQLPLRMVSDQIIFELALLANLKTVRKMIMY